jgi:hypothetical protein
MMDTRHDEESNTVMLAFKLAIKDDRLLGSCVVLPLCRAEIFVFHGEEGFNGFKFPALGVSFTVCRSPVGGGSMDLVAGFAAFFKSTAINYPLST